MKILFATCCVAACSPEPATQPSQEASPVVEPAGSTGDAEQGSETSEAEALATEDDEGVIEIGGSGKRDPFVVPVKPIVSTPAEVVWRELTRLPDPTLELVPVASGIVGRSPIGVYELDADGQLTLRPGLTLPEVPLLGHWPDDVWYVESSPLPANADGRPTFDYQLFHLDRDRQWIAQKHKGQLHWRGEAQAVRKGWLAGVLIRDSSTLTRIGSRKEAPKTGIRMGKILLDTIESASGRLYNVSLRKTTVYVQETCFEQTCVDEHARKLPPGGEWSFGAQIPRERNSVSVVAIERLADTSSHQLLHYETGGWSLEPLDQPPSGLWPAEGGGLWMVVGSELMYRSSKGHWYAIALPDGAGKISAAMRSDLRELWVATKIGEQTVVFATEANVQGLPTPGAPD